MLRYLYSVVPSSRNVVFPGEKGIQRASYFLDLLGNPQEKLKVIHLAGTSGKGSTASLTSQLLEGQGFKVGLHLSPHLLDIRERLQINNQLLSKEKIRESFQALLPAIQKVETSPLGPVTFFEILVTWAFYLFQKEGVDYAVMETGLGGLYDATNTVKNPQKLVLLTKIGHDHQRLLGKTLPEIAFQKAMIIQPGNTALASGQVKSVRMMMEKVATKKKATLSFIEKTKNYQILQSTIKGTVFDFSYDAISLSRLRLSLLGEFQVENASLALSAVCFLSRRDQFTLDQAAIRDCLKTARVAGRMERQKINNKIVIIDGAHNQQKMKALGSSLRTIFPHQKFAFLVSFKQGKDYRKMLEEIFPLAEDITLTSIFKDQPHFRFLSQPLPEVSTYLKRQSPCPFEIEEDPRRALGKALAKTKSVLVITGSLYLLGDIYTPLRELAKRPHFTQGIIPEKN